jgi:hypothetical protein
MRATMLSMDATEARRCAKRERADTGLSHGTRAPCLMSQLAQAAEIARRRRRRRLARALRYSEATRTHPTLEDIDMARLVTLFSQASLASLALLTAAAVPGCLDRPIETVEPNTTTGVTEVLTNSNVDKIDILLVIDDSGSMGDKQDILAEAVPNLVAELANPSCVDDDGTVVSRPDSGLTECPEGSYRAFEPVLDINIGVINTSVDLPYEMGGVGCQQGATKLVEVDGPKYAEGGFLAWRPALDDNSSYQSSDALEADLRTMVAGVGEEGCGYEANLESWYRFLVDPDATETVKRQRKQFVRPDSLVAIVMLSDENDCSFDASKIDQETATTLIAEGELSCARHPDLLYPTQRYIDGVSSRTVKNSQGEMVDNPLLVQGDVVRSTNRVFLTGIVGVPWQLVARDDDDLGAGFKSADELKDGSWDAILGNKTKGIAPAVYMQQSVDPREGLDPNGALVDPIVGHDRENDGTLQYACIFELPEPIDCTVDTCDCQNDSNPLCQDRAGNKTDLQLRAKAYPSLRQLSVLKEIGSQAIVGSICAANTDPADKAANDYGYKPAIEALTKELQDQLGGQCLSRSLTPDADGQVTCVVIEGRVVASADSCSCDEAGRSEVLPAHLPATSEAQGRNPALNCFCEIDQLAGAELKSCQSSMDDSPKLDGGGSVDGWCYIDAETFPKTGNEALVQNCKPTQRRKVRFVGGGEPQDNAVVVINCNQ